MMSYKHFLSITAGLAIACSLVVYRIINADAVSEHDLAGREDSALASTGNGGATSRVEQKRPDSQHRAISSTSRGDERIEPIAASSAEEVMPAGDIAEIVFGEPPHIAYKHFEESARAGDAKAQLYLALVINRCANYYNADELAERESQGILDGDILEGLAEISKTCRGLDDVLGKDEFENERQRWLATAAINESPIAELMINRNQEVVARYHPEVEAPLDAKSKAELVVDALKYAGTDDVLLGEAISQAEIFYADNFERLPDDFAISGGSRRTLQRDAWTLLSCKYQAQCPYDQMSQMLQDTYYLYEFEEIIERSAKLEDAILAQDWDELGLRRP